MTGNMLTGLGTDAKLWADEFCRLNPGTDHERILGWFANAIMAGWDEASRRKDREPLIAAAPEMLAILREIPRSAHAPMDEWASWRARVEAVLASPKDWPEPKED